MNLGGLQPAQYAPPSVPQRQSLLSGPPIATARPHTQPLLQGPPLHTGQSAAVYVPLAPQQQQQAVYVDAQAHVPVVQERAPFQASAPESWTRDARDTRDVRDSRDFRDSRDARDTRDSRDMRDSRDSRNSRDARDARDPSSRHDDPPPQRREPLVAFSFPPCPRDQARGTQYCLSHTHTHTHTHTCSSQHNAVSWKRAIICNREDCQRVDSSLV